MKTSKHRRIAPRLASGESRIPAGNALPPIVKFALTTIAAAQNQSRSWVIEQILIDWAQHNPSLQRMLRGAVDYIPRKTPEADDQTPDRIRQPAARKR